MKPLLFGIAFAGAAMAADPGSFHSGSNASAPPHPSMYSFVDVYRLTVAGPMAGLPPLETAPDAPIRVAVAQAQPAEPRFTVKSVPQPDTWLVILAGVAFAGWVAHRRLVHSL